VLPNVLARLVFYMSNRIKPIEPPDSFHLIAADGWLGLGDHLAADEELDKITPELRAHPHVLSVRYEIYAKAKKWDGAAEIAGVLVKLMPNNLRLGFVWRMQPGENLAAEFLKQKRF